MDKFVRNFIIASIFYLGISSILGIAMLHRSGLLSLKFVHSHLNILWCGVSHPAEVCRKNDQISQTGRTAVLDIKYQSHRHAALLYPECAKPDANFCLVHDTFWGNPGLFDRFILLQYAGYASAGIASATALMPRLCQGLQLFEVPDNNLP